MKRIIYLIAVLFLGFSSLSKAETIDGVIDARLKDVTIIISSCDKYAELWEPFAKLIFKYWPSLKTYNKNVPIILITNKKPFSFKGIQNFQTGEDKSWSDNMLQVLSHVKTKYVLYLQEDYFLSQPVNDEFLCYLIKKMEQNHIPYIQLNQDTASYADTQKPFFSVKNSIIKSQYLGYRTALQAAFWKKDVFEWLIKKNESPWEFESYGGMRSAGMRSPFLAIVKDYPITFVNAINLGFWQEGSLEFLRQEGIDIKTVLPVAKDYPFTLWLKNNYPKIFPYWKTFLKFIGYSLP
ncbi:MAG: hypothetical protein WCG05_03425 [Alphaproteobacteria bacterium]